MEQTQPPWPTPGRHSPLRHTLLLSLGAAGLLLLTPAAVCAQNVETLTEASQQQVARLLDDAQSRYEADDVPGSIDALKRAYAILPTPKIQRRLGELYTLNAQPQEAISAYTLYLSLSKSPPDQAEVQAEIAALQDALGAIPLSVTSSPDGATVRRTDTSEVLGTTPLNGLLPPGSYTLEIQKEGWRTARREVTLKAGREAALEVALERETLGVSEPVSSASGGPSTGVWILGGVGVASGVAAITLTVLAGQLDDELSGQEERKSSSFRAEDYDQKVDKYNAYRVSSYITTGVALGALGTAALLWAIQDDTPAPTAGLGVTWNPALGQAALRWHASF